MSKHFLDTEFTAEEMRNWQLVLCIQPRPGNEVGLREIIDSVLIHERQYKTQCELDFNVNGLNPVRVNMSTYALKYQYDNPQETQTRASWGNHLGFFASLCDVFGHQQRLTATFKCGPLNDFGFQLDGTGCVRESFQFGEGGG